jgi:hypothetical protein
MTGIDVLDSIVLDMYWSPWWELFVGTGPLVLSVGSAQWGLGCLRLVLTPHVRFIGIALAVAGAFVALGAIAGAVFLDITEPHRYGPRVLFGWTVTGPDFLLLPDDAFTWVPLGIGLGLSGIGLLALPRKAR